MEVGMKVEKHLNVFEPPTEKGNRFRQEKVTSEVTLDEAKTLMKPSLFALGLASRSHLYFYLDVGNEQSDELDEHISSDSWSTVFRFEGRPEELLDLLESHLKLRNPKFVF